MSEKVQLKKLLGKKVVAVRLDGKTGIVAIHLEGDIKVLVLDEMISRKNLNEQIKLYGQMSGITFHLLEPGQ